MISRRWLGVILCILLGAAVMTALLAHSVVSRRVDQAVASASAPRVGLAIKQIPLHKRAPEAHLWTNSSEANDGVLAAGRLFVTTWGGLVEFSLSGDMSRLRTVLDDQGLTDHSLSAISVRGSSLYLGSHSGKLTVIEGNRARSYAIDGSRQGAIVDMLWHENQLFLATASGRVIRLDADLQRAHALTPVVPGGAGVLSASSDSVFVGGGNGLVYKIEQDELIPLAAPVEGDQPMRITALLWREGDLLAGNASGLFRVDEQGRFQSLQKNLFVTSLLSDGNGVLVGTFDDGVIVLDEQRLGATPRSKMLPRHRVDRLRLLDGAPFVFGPGLVARIDPSPAPPRFYKLPPGLASNHITALSFDDRQRLWVGHFDHGVDVLDRSGAVERHLPDATEETHSSVNDLAFDPHRQSMLIATSHGVLEAMDTRVRVIDENDGLIGENVAALMVRGALRVFATSRGLTMDSADGMRSLYAFHGLPSNRLYALTWQRGDRFAVGTLGGAAIIEGPRVVDRIRAEPSGLHSNWCTAMAAAREGTLLFVGTMGGGITLWRDDGSTEELELPEVGMEYTVSPGAMLIENDHLIIGTQARGLLIFNWNRSEWVHFEQPLPGAAVTALTTEGRALYMGTDRGLMRFRLDLEAMGAES